MQSRGQKEKVCLPSTAASPLGETDCLIDAKQGDTDIDSDYVPQSDSSEGSSWSESLPFLQLRTRTQESTMNDAAPREQNTDGGGIQGITLSEVPKPQKHYCLFCGEPQARLPRHIETKHKNEKEALPYTSALKGVQKKAELAKLRHAGDHQHNLKVLKEKEGMLVVKRRKKANCPVDNFLPCPHCLGYFQKKDLYRHKCVDISNPGPRRQLAKKGKLLLPEDDVSGESEAVRYFLATLSSDHISLIAKNDRLITALARRLVKKNGFDKDKFGTIRNKIREMGRLLKELRDLSKQPNATLEQFITPERFSIVVDGTKRVAGYSEEDFVFKIPTLAKKLGHSLVACADMLEAKAVETRDECLLQNAKGYLTLHKMRWNEEISAHAIRTLYCQKKGHAKRIPLTKDVVTLSNHLNKASSTASEKVFAAESDVDIKQAWKTLAEVTLTQIILFNRRRSGEASKITMTDLKATNSHDPDVLKSLSDFEKKLCTKLTRIEVFGKCGRIVPILLSKQTKSSVDLLVTKREQAGVSSANQFVFACSHFQSDGHLRGSDTLRKYVESAKLAQPELITATSLRKQIATLSQIVNLRENELDVLAQYMGHDIRVHREVYRLPSDTMQLAKVSKLLLALEKGTLTTHQRCSLDDVEVESDEEVTSDEEESVSISGQTRAVKTKRSSMVTAQDSSVSVSGETRSFSPKKRKMTAVDPDVSVSGTETVGEKRKLTAEDSEGSSEDDAEMWAAPVKKKSSKAPGRYKWSAVEAEAVERHLLKNILTCHVPGKQDIERCLAMETVLKNRSWLHVKNYVRNRITARQRAKPVDSCC